MLKSSSKERSSGLRSLVRQHLDVCVPRGVINANMNVLVSDSPLTASTTRARVSIDAVSRSTNDPRQSLDVDMDHLTRGFPLVTTRWGRWPFEVSDPRETFPSKNATDSRRAHAQFVSDPCTSKPLFSKCHDMEFHGLRRTVRRVMGTGGAIHQRIDPIPPPSSKPPITRTFTHPGGLTGVRHLPTLQHDTMYKQDSTPEAASSILMNVHLGSPFGICGLSPSDSPKVARMDNPLF